MSASADHGLSPFLKMVRASLAPLDKNPHASASQADVSQTGLLSDLEVLDSKDYQTLLQLLNASVTGVNDDNNLLVERLVQLLAKLPPHSKKLKELGDGFINQLWTTLDHPPVVTLDNRYKYRRADGSYNSIHDPQLGAAGSPYARSVKPTVFQNPDLPDPEVVFQKLSENLPFHPTLLAANLGTVARGDKFEPHPQGISSMLFYLATIIIHDIFQTSPMDWNINRASSYLDLSPLYGGNDKEVEKMRTFKDGLLQPDCFSSGRILGFPPGCAVFLIMFNRFHNYVATQLAL